MNQRAQLIAICGEAGYDITKDNLRLEPHGFFSSYLTWRWHVVFDDEPHLDYIFMEHEDGGFCLVDIVGDGIPEKSFESVRAFHMQC